jgi:hypothetical protein
MQANVPGNLRRNAQQIPRALAAPAAQWAAAPAAACPRSRARATARTRLAAPRRRATAGSRRRARRSAAPAAAAGTSLPPCPRPARMFSFTQQLLTCWTHGRSCGSISQPPHLCTCLPIPCLTKERHFQSPGSVWDRCASSAAPGHTPWRVRLRDEAPAPGVLTGRRRPHACQSGCWWLAGRRGMEAGVQCAARITRSASRKFRNRLATSRSCARAPGASARRRARACLRARARGRSAQP